MVTSLALGLALLALADGAAPARDTPFAADTPRESRERVDHHLREVNRLVQHFEGVLAQECPRFARRSEWSAYLDQELDQLVLLLAHKEEAWAEAKQTGDDELRRHAKMPRDQRDHARALAEKFQTCAEGNGASFSPTSLWRRIERDVPHRRAAIALPP
jgi:hypothetical protein